MACLNKNDVREIIEMLEDEVNFVPRLTSSDKMKLRCKIRRQDNWLSDFINPTSDKIVRKLDGRLSDVFRLYPYGFSKKLKEKLDIKIAKMYRNEVSVPPFMAPGQNDMGQGDRLERRVA